MPFGPAIVTARAMPSCPSGELSPLPGLRAPLHVLSFMCAPTPCVRGASVCRTRRTASVGPAASTRMLREDTGGASVAVRGDRWGAWRRRGAGPAVRARPAPVGVPGRWRWAEAEAAAAGGAGCAWGGGTGTGKSLAEETAGLASPAPGAGLRLTETPQRTSGSAVPGGRVEQAGSPPSRRELRVCFVTSEPGRPSRESRSVR